MISRPLHMLQIILNDPHFGDRSIWSGEGHRENEPDMFKQWSRVSPSLHSVSSLAYREEWWSTEKP